MRNRQLTTISEINNITTALSHYDRLCSYISQLDPNQEGCKTIYNRLVEHSNDKKYPDSESYRNWSDIDLHVVNQLWGSTSGGWGGIGGAAMSNYYTIVIENTSLSISCIYYQGKLAYILDINKEYYELIEKGYKRLPSLNGIKSKNLTPLYISKK